MLQVSGSLVPPGPAGPFQRPPGPIGPRCKVDAKVGRGDRDGTEQRVTEETDRAGGAAPVGKRSRTAASIAPGDCGKDGAGSSPWWPGQGRWQWSPRLVPGLSGHCPAPRNARRSLHGFQRFIVRRERKKKEREKEKRKLSCQIGKIFSSCSLAGEAAGNRDHEAGSGYPEPGGSASPAPGGRPPLLLAHRAGGLCAPL